LITAFLCLAVPLSAFAGAPKDITVSAAISLKNAFEDIGGLYESKYGTKCVFKNVRQALDYVARGEVDAGVVYATDAAARSKEIKIITIAPEASHKPVLYPIAVIKRTKSEADAKAFIALVLSPEGKKILQKHGFRSNK